MAVAEGVGGRLKRRLTPLLALLSLPPTLAHELTHAVVSLPWARELALVIEPRGAAASVYVDYYDSVPSWAVVAAHYAPLVIGSLLGAAAGAWWLLTAQQAPTTAVGWAKLSIALSAWWVYVTPSRADISPTNVGGDDS